MQPEERWTLLAAVIGSGIVFLDSTIVTVALPRIGQELRSTTFGVLEAQSYVYNGYLLTLGALLVLAGALGDTYGRRRVFLIGLASFGAASVLCGLAPNMEALIAFRVLQGAAGALLVPGSLALITAGFAEERRGRAFGFWAGASGLTTILGPLVGGVLVDSVSWRAAFLVNVPLVAIALWATAAHVSESRDEEATGRFDWLGAAVVALAVGGLAFGTIRGQERDWQATSAFAALAVGTVATLVLPFLMTRRRHPLVPPQLFRIRNFTVTNIATLLIYGALYVTLYVLTLFLQGTLGYNATGAGLATVPSVLLLALFSARVGGFADRYGPRWFMTVGPAVMALGVLWLARIPSASDPWVLVAGDPGTWLPPASYVRDVLPGMLGFGVGLTLLVAPLTAALMNSVPVRHAGVASAVNNAISRVGPQLVGALLFVAVTAAFHSALAERVPDLPPRAELREQVAPLNPAAEGTPEVLAEAARAASTEAAHLAMLCSAGLLLAGAAVSGAGIRNVPRSARASGAGEAEGETLPGPGV